MDAATKMRVGELLDRLGEATTAEEAVERLDDLVREVAPTLTAQEQEELQTWLVPVRAFGRFLTKLSVAAGGMEGEWETDHA